jgi:hypothetical protein
MTDAREMERRVSSRRLSNSYIGFWAAMTYLQKSCDERNAQYLFYLNTLPWFASLNSDPRFQDLVHRIGLPTTKSSNRAH